MTAPELVKTVNITHTVAIANFASQAMWVMLDAAQNTTASQHVPLKINAARLTVTTMRRNVTATIDVWY